ncbi:tyrosine-type recombinase/integrase [Kordiimonas sp.]|uniref:phage integrase n=1 Tax=Kordiimonas sp. TaxID=1970157 RepID=UPI003A8FE6A9
MRTSITRKLLDTTKPKATPFDIRCTRMKGLIVRVQPSGAMTFYCEYDRNRRLKLGRADHLSLTEAHDRVRDIMKEVYEGVDPSAEKRKQREELTIEEFIDGYYEPWATSHLRSGEAVVKRIRVAFKAHLGTKLSKVSVFDMERFRSARLKQGVTATTVNRDTGALRALLSRAEEWGFLDTNPLGKLKRLRVEDVTPPRYLQDDERERLFAALDAREQRRIEERDRYNQWRRERKHNEYPDFRRYPFTDHLKPMIILSLNTGLRRNELFTLTWDNVYLTHTTPFLTVRAAFAKSKKSRHVQLNALAVETLRQWRTMWERNTGNLVFGGRTGGEFDNVSSSWAKLLKDAGLNNFRWHDMRHDFASRLAMAGVNLNTIRELLGHSDYKMTLRYAHLSPKEGYDAVNMLV